MSTTHCHKLVNRHGLLAAFALPEISLQAETEPLAD